PSAPRPASGTPRGTRTRRRHRHTRAAPGADPAALGTPVRSRRRPVIPGPAGPHAGRSRGILGGMPPRVSAAVMVGRTEPLGVLSEALAATRVDGGRLVVVGGEAGSGKTRLVNEFLGSLGEAVRLQGGCLELGEAV